MKAWFLTCSCPLIRFFGTLFWDENYVNKLLIGPKQVIFSQLKIITNFHPNISYEKDMNKFWFATDFSKARQILVWVGKTCNMNHEHKAKKWQKGFMLLSWLRLGLLVILHKHVERCLEFGLKLNWIISIVTLSDAGLKK